VQDAGVPLVGRVNDEISTSGSRRCVRRRTSVTALLALIDSSGSSARAAGRSAIRHCGNRSQDDDSCSEAQTTSGYQPTEGGMRSGALGWRRRCVGAHRG
jgi:hypothetical protein